MNNNIIINLSSLKYSDNVDICDSPYVTVLFQLFIACDLFDMKDSSQQMLVLWRRDRNCISATMQSNFSSLRIENYC